MERVEELVRRLKGSKKAPGVEEILVPGERAFRERQIRTKEGIPIDAPTWMRITEILDDLGIKKDYTGGKRFDRITPAPSPGATGQAG